MQPAWAYRLQCSAQLRQAHKLQCSAHSLARPQPRSEATWGLSLILKRMMQPGQPSGYLHPNLQYFLRR